MILLVLQIVMLNLAHVQLCAEHMLRRLFLRGFDSKLNPQTSAEILESLRQMDVSVLKTHLEALLLTTHKRQSVKLLARLSIR